MVACLGGHISMNIMVTLWGQHARYRGVDMNYDSDYLTDQTIISHNITILFYLLIYIK